MCLLIQVSAGACISQKMVLELFVSHLTWVLGNKLRCSVRILQALNSLSSPLRLILWGFQSRAVFQAFNSKYKSGWDPMNQLFLYGLDFSVSYKNSYVFETESHVALFDLSASTSTARGLQVLASKPSFTPRTTYLFYSYGCHSPSSHKNPVILSFTLKSLVHWGLFLCGIQDLGQVSLLFFLGQCLSNCGSTLVGSHLSLFFFLQLCKVVRSIFTCLYC